MAKGKGTDAATAAQAALTDDPAFLRGLLERALQQLLEAEMTAHLGAERMFDVDEDMVDLAA